INLSEIKDQLENNYRLAEVVESKAILIQKIEHPIDSNDFIKVDLVKYPYKLINPPIIADGIRLLSKEDIIPMKLSAIANRGSKKDFYDIYFLLFEYSLKEMLKFYEIKFTNHNYFHVIKSLTYFEDAEKEINPKVIKDCRWQEVKKMIQRKVQESF
ncbi:MAG: nucleotidyl transferase AbiEii/AbiGii toxin family protein, partial [Bacteroidetes bacterium]|nr:nucleotidyl transferase AbiEii/AbiGii toxin family protein [Bacteroidota bacterium]